MKKDYLPVTLGDSALSETAFIEQFWTQKWQERTGQGSLAARVEQREEFKRMQPYLASLPPSSRILDSGCGTGEWTLYLTEQGYAVTGLDLSQETIRKLQEKFPSAAFVAGDLRRTGFEPESFEACFSWGAFEHFEEGLSQPLREAHRILKKSGYLFITVPFQNTRHLRRERPPLWKWDEHFQRGVGYPRPMRFYQWRLTQPELQRELEMNGFQTLQIEPIQKLHGLRRLVQLDLRLDPATLPGKVALGLLYLVTPKSYAAHMLFAAGLKR